MDIPAIARAAKQKGIKLVATGDFTHPEYFASLKKHLRDAGNGLYTFDDVHFIVNTEVNNIYSAAGRLRRIHNLIFVPSLESAAGVSGLLSKYGKLDADGRPSVSISCYEMLARIMEIEPRAFIVPAHIWTPWFSLYGSHSGFDSFAECFGDLADEVFAVETGLSSDPPMNWRISELDHKTLISNSDAHSPSRLGREANVFDCELNYDTIREVLKTGDRKRFLFTIEFFPEEGKYHYDGHRSCGVRVSPAESILSGDICPVCGRKLTIGVLHRVEQLADRKVDNLPRDRIPFRHLVPLEEIIAEALKLGRETAGVARKYEELVTGLAPEFEILLDVPISEIARYDELIAQGVERMRRGEIIVEPGFDGVFGTVQVLPGAGIASAPSEPRNDEGKNGRQLKLFG
jgi:uncharacterized protein (TIGR00375 family)